VDAVGTALHTLYKFTILLGAFKDKDIVTIAACARLRVNSFKLPKFILGSSFTYTNNVFVQMF
jgi:hypothetical protein